MFFQTDLANQKSIVPAYPLPMKKTCSGYAGILRTPKHPEVPIVFDAQRLFDLLPRKKITLKRRAPGKNNYIPYDFGTRRRFVDNARDEFNQIIGYFRLAGREMVFGFDLELEWKIYELHHLLPRCYGGDNSFENLVMIHPALHYLIHREIDRCALRLKDGESRTVKIPWPQGRVCIPQILPFTTP